MRPGIQTVPISDGAVTITGTAKQERTRQGFVTITLTGDIWED